MGRQRRATPVSIIANTGSGPANSGPNHKILKPGNHLSLRLESEVLGGIVDAGSGQQSECYLRLTAPEPSKYQGKIPMTLSSLDQHTALIVIDLQAGTVANPTAHPTEEVVARSAELLSAFRRQALPVVLATMSGTPAGRTEYSDGPRDFPPSGKQLLPELHQQPQDLTLTRQSWSAFAGSDLAALLRERGVTQVVLAGMATSFGVESTARDAYDLGFSVALVLDAMTDPSLDAHLNSATRIFPALGQTGSTSEIIKLLDER